MDHHKILLSHLFFVFSLLPLPEIAIAQLPSVIPYCYDHGNYTKNSIFQTNLQTAISFNTTNVINGFYNFSGDWKSDRLDVIGLCQGYVNSSSCRSCLDDSIKNLRQSCPNQKEAIGWAADCMIRYANRSILHKNETSPAVYLTNRNNASDPTRFNKAVGGLLDDLRAKANGGGPTIKYATGETNSTNPSEKIYGLVQCTPDLSPEQCNSCLNMYLAFLPACCNGKIGGRVLGPSCNFRYEVYSFFNPTLIPNAPIPAPAPAPQATAPPPQIVPSPPPNGIAATPTPSTPASGMPPPPPPPPPQGSANRHVAFFSFATVMVAIPTIFIL